MDFRYQLILWNYNKNERKMQKKKKKKIKNIECNTRASQQQISVFKDKRRYTHALLNRERETPYERI